MGYTTDFVGHLNTSRVLTSEEVEFIQKFNDVRHMRRNVDKLHELYHGKHGNPFAKTKEEIYGREGEYFVGGEANDGSILDYNEPPGSPDRIDDWMAYWNLRQEKIKTGESLPGLWCQWTVDTGADGEHRLVWDGGEKFYNYVEWLKYLIDHFFEKWGVKLNGQINWEGEDRSDIGQIVVKENTVTIKTGKVVYS